MKDKTPSYIRLGILTIITALSWIAFNVYRILTTKPAPNVPEKVMASFSPSLDTQKIGEIESRIFFEEGEVAIINTPTPTSAPSEEPQPTETPIPTETPVPTESPQ